MTQSDLLLSIFFREYFADGATFDPEGSMQTEEKNIDRLQLVGGAAAQMGILPLRKTNQLLAEIVISI